jgi:hypothetical protein
METITFENQVQATLFACNLCGEDSPIIAKVQSTDNPVGCSCDFGDDFDFNVNDYMDLDGSYLLAYARLAKAGWTISQIKELEGLLTIDASLYSHEELKRLASEENYGTYWSSQVAVYEKCEDIEKIKVTLADETYGMEQLEADLKAIKRIVHVRN